MEQLQQMPAVMLRLSSSFQDRKAWPLCGEGGRKEKAGLVLHKACSRQWDRRRVALQAR